MRVRIEFDERLTDDEKNRRCWFETSACAASPSATMRDLAACLTDVFRLRGGIELLLEGFLLPFTQPLTLLRENDCIR
jgi:hypothetical protein